MAIRDRLGRPLRSLRLSVTDRCNLRCRYCMPEAEYRWLPREEILSFEELERLVRLFVAYGVDRLRLTGGEPLLRPELPTLVSRLAQLKGLRDLALTTNGVLLAERSEALFAAGLHRITVSLDTLRPDRFRAVTGRSLHAQVLAGIAAAAGRGSGPFKLDAVVMRGFNDDELAPLIEHGRAVGAEVRFIEYMDVGGATRWRPGAVVSRDEILVRLRRRYGEVTPLQERASSAPAARYALPDGTTFGIIASVTAPFCGLCDRARLTADGTWFHCLYATQGVDLRTPLRSSADDALLGAEIQSAWSSRENRGAELRAGLRARTAVHSREQLERDPHLEMHARGG